MKFQSILNAISLLTNRQKGFLYNIVKKPGILSLTTLFISSEATIGANDIKNSPSLQYRLKVEYSCPGETTTTVDCIRNISLATASSQRTFDYDPSMLPEVAEVIFALRVKHTNTGGPFVINFSGNYLLEFTKDKINILDTYTKNSDVYEYQSRNPNITMGLGVSIGLPGNYKSIVIKEDAHGQLYDYAALRIDNITTDETMLSETLSHPFYEVVGRGAVENTVNVTKAMTFYRPKPSHSRHARCIKSSSTILEQFMEIFRSGSAVCGPKSAVDIRSANHKTAAEMKLDQPLVEATVNTSKYPERLGFHLLERVDLHGKNPVALLAAAYFCKKSVLEIIGNHRKKRALDNECGHWADLMVGLYRALGLEYKDMYEIVEHVKKTNSIPASYFPGRQYPPDKEDQIDWLVSLIYKNINRALELLQDAAAVEGEAAGASEFQCVAQCQASGGSSVAEGGIETYILNEKEFKPEQNVVKTIKRKNLFVDEVVVHSGEQYTTDIFYLSDNEQITNINKNIKDAVSSYIETLKHWKRKIIDKRQNCGTTSMRPVLDSIGYSIKAILYTLSHLEKRQNIVISAVHHNNILVGVIIGRIDKRTYYQEHEVELAASTFGDDGAYTEQLYYLNSEVLKFLLSKDLIDRSEIDKISNNSTGHDEL